MVRTIIGYGKAEAADINLFDHQRQSCQAFVSDIAVQAQLHPSLSPVSASFPSFWHRSVTIADRIIFRLAEALSIQSRDLTIYQSIYPFIHLSHA
jgi:hypothetical protein